MTATDKDTAQKKKKRTVGNRVYDWGVYTTFAWAGVAAFSMFLAHESLHGTHKMFGWLRSLNKGIHDGLSGILSKTVMKHSPKENVEEWAKATTLFTILYLGGSMLMAPIKWLEDHRHSNAAKIDNLLGTTPPDPETIAKEPKQTWKSLLSARFLSSVIGYGGFILVGPRIAGKSSRWFGEKFTGIWQKLRPNCNAETVRKWADIGAFDAMVTAGTAATTYGFSRLIARKNDPAPAVEDALYLIDPATPTPQETSSADVNDKSSVAAPSLASKFDKPKESHTQKLAATADNLPIVHSLG